MSWVNKEKSKTGDVQYINASYTEALSTTTTLNSNPFNVIGYTKGSISYMETFGPRVSQIVVNLQGSNDNTNYFDFNSSNTHTSGNDVGKVSWNIPTKFVRVKTTVTTTAGAGEVNSIDLVGTAGGSGGDIDSSSIIDHMVGGGTNKQIQFNDNGVFGGALGALYDKTVNSNAGQLQITDGTLAFPSIAFSDGIHPAGNYDVGIYRQGVDQIGFGIVGSLIMGVSASGISLTNGSIARPSINFGIDGNVNTGMYRKDADTIGFSTGNVEKVSIYPSNSGDFIEGLNIGTTGRIAGIRRLSATAAESWEDGYMGDSSFIVFTARDFEAASDGGIAFYADSADGFNSAQTSGNIGLVAQKIIPKGFQIDTNASFVLYTQTQNTPVLGQVFIVQTGNIESGIGSTSQSYRFNNSLALTNVFHNLTTGGPDIGTGINTVLILWDPNTPTIDEEFAVLGAKIKIERV